MIPPPCPHGLPRGSCPHCRDRAATNAEELLAAASEQAARESRLRERIARLRLALQTIAANHAATAWLAERARLALEEDDLGEKQNPPS